MDIEQDKSKEQLKDEIRKILRNDDYDSAQKNLLIYDLVRE